VIAFYLALWLFGWIETAWVLIMLPAMLLLLRAERHPVAHSPAAAPRGAKRPPDPGPATGDGAGDPDNAGK
jgi:hypothetical protein